MNEVVTLVLQSPGTDQVSKRTVFAGVQSIGMSEFYQANAQGIRPEAKFVLADYLDYNGENLLCHDGVCYRIIRTYRTGHALELTVVRASMEEAKLCGS